MVEHRVFSASCETRKKCSEISIIITTPNGETLTATYVLQCGVDSSQRLHYVAFQEMRKV